MTADKIFGILIESGIFGLILGLVVSLIRYAKAMIDAKTAEISANIKDSKIRSAISSAEDCVTTVVLEMSQTVVDDLKAKSADGKLTDDEIKAIKSDALEKIKKLISGEIYNTLSTVFGDVEAWLNCKIEAEVKKLKLTSQASKDEKE